MELRVNSITKNESCISESEFNKLIHNKNICMEYNLGLYDNNKKIGFMFFTLIPCFIAKINNIEIYRKLDKRKGYGKLIYNEAEKIIKQNCIKHIIGDAYEESLEFWKKIGFKDGKFESNLMPIEKRL